MRRPFLMIFIMILMIALICTQNKSNNKFKNDVFEINGVVKSFKTKERYNEYEVDEYLVRDYTKTSNIKVGHEVYIKGDIKNLEDMKYENFDYGRYLRSKG